MLTADVSLETNELPLNQEDVTYFHSVRHWIYNHTGLYYPERKYSTLYHRLRKLCRELNIPNLKVLDKHLKEGDLPSLSVQVACAVSTNHTYFFREEETMNFFREQILPNLPADEQWRIWSAASSSGDEAYSLALILAEKLGEAEAVQKATILGTDISHTVLEQAELGICSEQRLDKIPLELRHKYFRRVGPEKWAINAEIKRICMFRRLNLMSTPWPFQQNFHVIFCRNVLYYFDRDKQNHLVERLYEITAPGGWLITSVTESLWNLKSRWQVVKTGIYRKGFG